MPRKAEKRKVEPQPARVGLQFTQKFSERVSEYKRILLANYKDEVKRRALARAIELVGPFSLDLNSTVRVLSLTALT